MLEKCSKSQLILFLLRNGGGRHPLNISTIELSRELGVSQQSISRWLIELEEEGLAERSRAGVRLTPHCVSRCRTLYHILDFVFESYDKVRIEGEVLRGVGDGKYYLSMSGYRKQVREKLGFTPFPGTLNVRITDPGRKSDLVAAPGIHLDGFLHDGRTLGTAKCFKCLVNGRTKAAVILPLRSHHGPDILEIIAPKSMRKILRLKDGSDVWIEVEL